MQNVKFPTARVTPHLMFVVSEDWYFWSHRSSVAKAAKAEGFEVTVVTNVGERGHDIEAAGLNLQQLHIPRSVKTPWRDAWAVYQLSNLIRRLRPDIVHSVSVKTGLLTAAARMSAPGPSIVYAFGGLGRLTAMMQQGGVLGRAAKWCLSSILGADQSHLILQNPEDMSDLLQTAVTTRDRITLIRGAGVCVETFCPSSSLLLRSAPLRPRILMASRMLWSKGVADFVEAARQLKGDGLEVDFVLAGRVDEANSDHVPEAQLTAWADEGCVTWIGDSNDLAQQLRESTAFCLPTFYGEGIPKVLLEAAASGLPIITTNTRGCREVCRPGENGFLIEPRDAVGLANAIKQTLVDESLRERMQKASRRIAESEFAEEIAVQQTLDVYRQFVPSEALPTRRRAA